MQVTRDTKSGILRHYLVRRDMGPRCTKISGTSFKKRGHRLQPDTTTNQCHNMTHMIVSKDHLSLSTLGSCKEKLLPVSSRQSSLSLAKPPGTTDSRLWEASRCFNCERRAKAGGKARSLFLARLRWRREVRLQVKLGKSSIKLLLKTS